MPTNTLWEPCMSRLEMAKVALLSVASLSKTSAAQGADISTAASQAGGLAKNMAASVWLGGPV